MLRFLVKIWGVLRQRRDPPRDPVSQGPSQERKKELYERSVPFLDQCVSDIDPGIPLPDVSQSEATSMKTSLALWLLSNLNFPILSHSNKARLACKLWFKTWQGGFRSPGGRAGGGAKENYCCKHFQVGDGLDQLAQLQALKYLRPQLQSKLTN
jgi:hypothetical protein